MGLTLLGYIPPVHRFLCHKVDAFGRLFFSPKSPSLAQYEQPLVTRKKMPAAEIHEILDGDDRDYELNPAHCSKWATEKLPLREDRNFDKFVSLCNEIPWERQYPFVKQKLQDDENFQHFLMKQFPLENIDSKFDELRALLFAKEREALEADSLFRYFLQNHFGKEFSLDRFDEMVSEVAQMDRGALKENKIFRALLTNLLCDQLIDRLVFEAHNDPKAYHSSLQKTLEISESNFAKYCKKCPKLIRKIPAERGREVYAANWVRLNMKLMVEVLKGNRYATSPREDLDDAMSHSAQILARMDALDLLDRENVLLKLAIEGGNYCCRAIKRASREIYHETIVPQEGLHLEALENFDPLQAYETRIRQALENERFRLIQEKYHTVVGGSPIVPKAVSKDVHGFDSYSPSLSIGFYPSTKQERDNLPTLTVPVWTYYDRHRKSMYFKYRKRLDEIVTGMREESYCFDFIRRNLAHLSEEESAAVIDKYIGKHWDVEETNSRFHRLLFVMLGALQKSKAPLRP